MNEKNTITIKDPTLPIVFFIHIISNVNLLLIKIWLRYSLRRKIKCKIFITLLWIPNTQKCSQIISKKCKTLEKIGKLTVCPS